MAKTPNLVVLFLILILSIGFISANTLVAGTLYNGSLNNPVSGERVTVYCGSLPSLYTNSLSDGTYAVVFESDSCTPITVESDFNYTQIVIQIEDEAPKTKKTINNPGGGNYYYHCGNGICDSGETTSTCSRDCPLAESNETIVLNENQEQEETSNQEQNLTEKEKSEEITPENNQGITGGVIGTLTSKGGIITIIAIIVLIIGFFIIRKYRKKSKIAKTKEISTVENTPVVKTEVPKVENTQPVQETKESQKVENPKDKDEKVE